MRRCVLFLTALSLACAAPAVATPKAGCYVEAQVGLLTGRGQDPTCTAVRPGLLVTVDHEGDHRLCQTSYLFYGTDGHRYLGTTGYCVLRESDCAEYVVLLLSLCLSSAPETDGPVVFPKGKGYPALLDGRRIGEVRYAVYESGAEFSSFALIRLDPKVVASPSIRGWGGPVGIDRRITTEPETVLLTAQVVQNEGVATQGFNGPVRFRGVVPMPAVALGGPLLTANGYAVGIVSTGDAGAYVERLDPLLQRAAERLRIRQLRLGTARFTG